MDSGPEVADLAGLFAPDAALTFAADPRRGTQESSLRGRDAIAEWAGARRAGGFQGPGSGTRHVVSTTLVTSSSGTESRLLSYFCFYGTTDAGPDLKAVGTYTDDAVLHEGRWLLASRVIAV